MFSESPKPEFQRIQDLPSGERPREKLAAQGPEALSNAELMALFISTGTKGRSAIDIGRELLAKHGSMHSLGNLSVAELAKEKGLGMAKASKLAAAFELGARVARERLRDVPLDTPELIYEFFAPQLRHLSTEQVICATLDVKLRHTSTTIISQGGLSETAAHPRDILRPVIARGAYGFIVVHNHPSGDASPSQADERLTQLLQEAARLMQVTFLDHVIIGRAIKDQAPFFSFRASGKLLS